MSPELSNLRTSDVHKSVPTSFLDFLGKQIKGIAKTTVKAIVSVPENITKALITKKQDTSIQTISKSQIPMSKEETDQTVQTKTDVIASDSEAISKKESPEITTPQQEKPHTAIQKRIAQGTGIPSGTQAFASLRSDLLSNLESLHVPCHAYLSPLPSFFGKLVPCLSP
mgnify:CR=1 FL=1